MRSSGPERVADMATIVVHKRTGLRYVLIGTGFGAYKSQSPSFFGGTLFPSEDEGENPVAAVSDAEGNILWMLTEELIVTEVDGKPVAEWLPRAEPYSIGRAEASGDPAAGAKEPVGFELCPGCSHRVAEGTSECPSCGLALIVSED